MSDNESTFKVILNASKPKKTPHQEPRAIVAPAKKKRNWPQSRSVICACQSFDYTCKGCIQKYRREWQQRKNESME